MNTAYTTNEYRQNDVMGATPIQLIIMVYDVAIQACQEEDLERALKAVGVLRDALNFDYGEATQLFALYQWSLESIRKNDYQSAIDIFQELRDAWTSVEQRVESRVDFAMVAA